MKKTPRLAYSPLTESFYVVTSYKEVGDGQIEAKTKFDVTDQVILLFPAIRKVCYRYNNLKKKIIETVKGN